MELYTKLCQEAEMGVGGIKTKAKLLKIGTLERTGNCESFLLKHTPIYLSKNIEIKQHS